MVFFLVRGLNNQLERKEMDKIHQNDRNPNPNRVLGLESQWALSKVGISMF
jgi:hypothetical protein